jgi:hypothetical protein
MESTIDIGCFNALILHNISLALLASQNSTPSVYDNFQELDGFCTILKKLESYKKSSTKDIINALRNEEEEILIKTAICNNRIKKILLSSPWPLDELAEKIRAHIMKEKQSDEVEKIVKFLDSMCYAMLQEFFVI